MEPAFHRGDLLFLTNRVEDPIRVGEIVVFRIEGREIPIVHRVLKIHEKYVQPVCSLFQNGFLFRCLRYLILIAQRLKHGWNGNSLVLLSIHFYECPKAW